MKLRRQGARLRSEQKQDTKIRKPRPDAPTRGHRATASSRQTRRTRRTLPSFSAGSALPRLAARAGCGDAGVTVDADALGCSAVASSIEPMTGVAAIGRFLPRQICLGLRFDEPLATAALGLIRRLDRRRRFRVRRRDRPLLLDARQILQRREDGELVARLKVVPGERVQRFGQALDHVLEVPADVGHQVVEALVQGLATALHWAMRQSLVS